MQLLPLHFKNMDRMGRKGQVEVTYHHFRETLGKVYVVLRTGDLPEQFKNHMATCSNKT